MYVVARGYWYLSHFQHEFRYIVMLSLIGGGSWSAGKNAHHHVRNRTPNSKNDGVIYLKSSYVFHLRLMDGQNCIYLKYNLPQPIT
jgi:hypothetical protein